MVDSENYGHKRLKSVIEALIERLKMLSGRKGNKALRFATDLSRSMLGTSLNPEGHASLDDDQAFDLSMRVEGFLVVLDIIAAVFLVERLKIMSGKGHWMAIHAVNDLCVAALRKRASRHRSFRLHKKRRTELMFRVENIFTTIGCFDGDPLVQDLLQKIIERYQD
jgi:hypothetical protein